MHHREQGLQLGEGSHACRKWWEVSRGLHYQWCQWEVAIASWYGENLHSWRRKAMRHMKTVTMCCKSTFEHNVLCQLQYLLAEAPWCLCRASDFKACPLALTLRASTCFLRVAASIGLPLYSSTSVSWLAVQPKTYSACLLPFLKSPSLRIRTYGTRTYSRQWKSAIICSRDQHVT